MLARRYAKAIFDIGSSQGDLDKLGADLRSFAKAMKDSNELVGVLTNPAIRRADRRKVVEGRVPTKILTLLMIFSSFCFLDRCCRRFAF